MTGDRSRRKPLDERLRRGLEPPAGAVERIVRGAIEPPPARGRGWRAVWAATATVALAASVLVVAFLLPRRETEGPFVEPVPEASRVSMTNVGDLIVVRRGPGGASVFSASAGSEDRDRSGQIMIVRGDRR